MILEVAKDLVIDLQNKNYNLAIRAKQLDTKSRIIGFSILDNSIPKDLTDHTARLYAIKPDLTEIYNDCTITDATKGKMSIELTNQMLAKEGIVYAELTIYGQDGSVLSTQIFNIIVDRSLRNDQSIISTNEFNALSAGIAKLDTWDAQFQTKYDSLEAQYATDLTQVKTELNDKAAQVDLILTNANVALKADKSEVTNVMTPKGNIAYASLPTSNNTIGCYYYCPDGDGTHGAGNYVWNGTAWYFGGTGNEGYNILKNNTYTSDINLIPDIIHYNEDFNLTTETGTTHSGYSWFAVPVTIPSGTNPSFALYSVASNGALTELMCYLWRKNIDGSKSAVFLNNYGSLYTIGYTCVLLYVEIKNSDLKGANLLFCKTTDSTAGYPFHKFARRLIRTGDNKKMFVMDNVGIDSIDGAYIYLDRFGNISFKFSNMNVLCNGEKYVYPFSQVVKDMGYPLVDYNYEYVKDVYLYSTTNGKNLYFNPLRCAIRLDTNTIENDIPLIVYNNGILSGLLVDYYKKTLMDERTYNKHSLTDEMLDNIHNTENNIYSIISKDKFIFAYMGDNHHIAVRAKGDADYTGMAVSEVDKNINLDCVLNAGDSILTVNSPTVLNPIDSLRQAYQYLPMNKVIYCQGNHDRNISPVLSKNEFYELTYKRYENDDSIHFGNPPATYFYKDFANKKMRIIVLDLYDIPPEYNYNDHSGYRQDQLQWLCNTALVVESDWQVMIVTHASPLTTDDGMTNNTGGQANRTLLPTILESFKNGTNVHITNTDVLDDVFTVNFDTNFTSQGGRTVIGVFSGHSHTDAIVNKNGINYISIACGYLDVVLYHGQLGERLQNTYSAIAFDICILDTALKTIQFKRFGWGSDRTISY